LQNSKYTETLGCGIWYQQLGKDKIGAAFTHSQGLSGDKLNTLNGLMINGMQRSMIWIGKRLFC
jgi:multimeric flavodoxin WrbA